MADFILGANMPIFFIVSGYFSYRTIVEFRYDKLFRHLKQYFCPFVAASVVFSVLAVCFGMIGLSQVPVYALKRVLFAGWFIWALAIVYSLSFIGYNIPRLWHGDGRIIWVVMAYVFLFAFPSGTWWVENVRKMAPHFLIGAFLLRRNEVYRNNWVGAIVMVGYLGMLVVEHVLSPTRITFYGLATNICHLLESPFDILLFLYVTGKGFVGAISIMWVVHWCRKNMSIVARYGTETLGIYIIHQWVLDRVVDAGLIPTRIPCVLLLAMALFLACHYLVVASKKLLFVRKYIWCK